MRKVGHDGLSAKDDSTVGHGSGEIQGWKLDIRVPSGNIVRFYTPYSLSLNIAEVSLDFSTFVIIDTGGGVWRVGYSHHECRRPGNPDSSLRFIGCVQVTRLSQCHSRLQFFTGRGGWICWICWIQPRRTPNQSGLFDLLDPLNHMTETRPILASIRLKTAKTFPMSTTSCSAHILLPATVKNNSFTLEEPEHSKRLASHVYLRQERNMSLIITTFYAWPFQQRNRLQHGIELS